VHLNFDADIQAVVHSSPDKAMPHVGVQRKLLSISLATSRRPQSTNVLGYLSPAPTSLLAIAPCQGSQSVTECSSAPQEVC
jgi:hypothetical protein